MSNIAPESWQVLLVSESPLDQKLLPRLLARHLHQVVVAPDGKDGLACYAAAEFNAVLIDALAVVSDSRELITGIRDLENRLGRTPSPIVALVDDEWERECCMQAGATACLSRPLQIVEFHDCVRSVRQIASAGELPVASAAESIDWKVALEAVGGRRELLTELLEIFDNEYPATLMAIQTAIEQQDRKHLQMSAHQLKGCLRYFGPTTASGLAGRLEDMGRSGRMDGAVKLIQPLVESLQRLAPLLRHGPTE